MHVHAAARDGAHAQGHRDRPAMRERARPACAGQRPVGQQSHPARDS